MTTVYPNAIDGYNQIRKVRDNIDEIIASDHNALRSAVVALEQTLGIKPQGPFGTVVERLNDAYSNIEAHVGGAAPRHQDNVIESPTRAGSIPSTFESSPYNIPSGTLASQLDRILVLLNDASTYGGSGSVTFADGYTFPISSVRATITQIINQLGEGTGGTSKISGAEIIGSTFSVPAQQLSAQLATIVDTISDFGGPSGAEAIGAETFDSYGGRYRLVENNVREQLGEVANYLDDNANAISRLFNSCVISGMDISGSGATATVASGHVLVNGRMIKFNGGTAFITDGSTNYVYAQFNSGSVSIVSSTSIPLDSVDTVALLRKIVRSGASWTSDIDLRRYGLFSNDKDYFSVGNTPAVGEDGYGCDFTSLRSAVEYVRVLNDQSNLIDIKKIKLINDLTISTSAEMSINLDIDGIEIDGGGSTIFVSVDEELFDINANNIVIKDLVVDGQLGAPGSSACFALIADTTTVQNLYIDNCKLTYTVEPLPYFLLVGNGGGTTYLRHAHITNNDVSVALGGIEYVISSNYSQIIEDSIISNNHIYQESYSISSYSGIKAGIRCIISNNLINGGFNTGILLTKPEQCVIEGNIIRGNQSSSIYMNTGIALYNNVNAEDVGCMISNNIVKGFDGYGVNCYAGSQQGSFITVSDNFIDNFFDVGLPPSTTVGIRGAGTECWILNNQITSPGVAGITEANNIIGNQIYGNSFSITTTTAAIILGASGSPSVVEGNSIVSVSGNGIDINDNVASYIANNLLYGASLTSDFGITNPGAETSIVGNHITSYTSGYINVDADRCLISNNYIDSYTVFAASGYNGITLSSADDTTISNNYLYQAPNGIVIDSSSHNNLVIGNYLIETQDEYGIEINGNYCSVNGNYLTDDSGSSIYISGTNTQVNNNYITGSGNIGIIADNGAEEITINGNQILSTTSDGIKISGTNYFMVNNNYLYQNGAMGINFISSNQGSICSNWIFSPVTFGIYIDGDVVLVQGNWIRDTPSQGIIVTIASDQASIVGNMLNRCGGTGFAQIDLDQCSNFSCVGNQVLNPTNINTIGISLNASDGGLVVGNRAEAGSSVAAFDYSGSTNHVIDGNMARKGSDPGSWNALSHLGDDNGYAA